MRRVAVLILLLALALGGARNAHAAKRVALVIGNDTYQSLPVLRKAVNDARVVAATLENIGFKVFLGENLTRRQMNRKLADFSAHIAPGDQAFVFFAGHGVALGAENYLIPADMPKPGAGEEDLVPDEAYAVNALVARVQRRGAASSFFVLDACRDNPFAAAGVRSIGGTRGFTRMAAPTGVFVLFSAGIGQTALDRLSDADPDPNSVFTRKLVPLLKTPGLTHVRLAKRVQQEVNALAGTVSHSQQPAYYDQIIGEIVLRPGGAPEAAPAKAPPPQAPVSAAAQAWTTIQTSTSPAVIEAFIKEFPDSVYATFAKARLAELKRSQEQKVAVGVFPERPKPEVGHGFEAGAEFQDCGECPQMVVVPAGSFMMGSPASEKGRYKDEGPQHRVTVPKPFAVGKFEVTVDQFSTFMRETSHDVGNECTVWNENKRKWEERSGKSFRDPGFSQTGSHPAACLNWDDAKAYVSWLSRKTGKMYRFLSEAEWEYAARSGTTTRFHFGDSESDLCGFANAADRSTSIGWKNKSCSDGVGEKTAEVGGYKANAFGLHDLHGNVGEWVEDCWNESYAGASFDGSSRTSGDCSFRVLRGGSWGYGPRYLRSANRLKDWSDSRSVNSGLRVARTLAP